MLWLQEPGVADALFDADVERALNGRWVLDHEAWRDGPVEERLKHALVQGIVDHIDADTEEARAKYGSPLRVIGPTASA